MTEALWTTAKSVSMEVHRHAAVLSYAEWPPTLVVRVPSLLQMN